MGCCCVFGVWITVYSCGIFIKGVFKMSVGSLSNEMEAILIRGMISAFKNELCNIIEPYGRHLKKEEIKKQEKYLEELSWVCPKCHRKTTGTFDSLYECGFCFNRISENTYKNIRHITVNLDVEKGKKEEKKEEFWSNEMLDKGILKIHRMVTGYYNKTWITASMMLDILESMKRK